MFCVYMHKHRTMFMHIHVYTLLQCLFIRFYLSNHLQYRIQLEERLRLFWRLKVRVQNDIGNQQPLELSLHKHLVAF